MKTGMRADGKILAVLCIVLMLLTGCGTQTASTPSSDGVDYNQYLNSPGYYACTDTAWYICPQTQIYFLDAGLKSPIQPLCAKADCDHNDRETCSSYLPSGAYSIFGWNNTLYYLRGSMEHTGIDLYQMDLDGQGRKLLTNLFPGVSNYSYSPYMGGGYLTVNLSEYTVNGDATTLYLISFAQPQEEPRVLFTNLDEVSAGNGNLEEVSTPYVMHVSEDWIFYVVTSGPVDHRSDALYGYQIATGETRLLVEDQMQFEGDLSPVADDLYWYDSFADDCGVLRSIDLTTGKINTVCEIPTEEKVWGSMDDKFLYILGGNDAETAELVVYDFTGTELQRLSCAELGTPLGYAFSSEDKVFFHSSALGEHDPICWVDLDKLEQGKAEFHLIEQ